MKSIWFRISNIGLTGNESSEQRRHIQIINRIILLACVFTPAFIPILLLTGNIVSTISQSAYSILIPFSFLLSRKGFFESALVVAYYLAASNITLASVINYNIGAEYLLLPLSLIPFMVFKKQFSSLFLFISTVLLFFIIQILKVWIPPLLVMREPDRLLLFHMILFMCFVVSLFIMYNFTTVLGHYEKSILQQKADIEDKKQMIEEKQKELLDSIHYAKRIQKALLPPEKYIDRNLTSLNKKI
jgi:hypothetical protein